MDAFSKIGGQNELREPHRNLYRLRHLETKRYVMRATNYYDEAQDNSLMKTGNCLPYQRWDVCE